MYIMIICHWAILHLIYNLSFQTIAGRSDGVFWWFPALSEDQEKICRIHQNYLVALILLSQLFSSSFVFNLNFGFKREEHNIKNKYLYLLIIYWQDLFSHLLPSFSSSLTFQSSILSLTRAFKGAMYTTCKWTKYCQWCWFFFFFFFFYIWDMLKYFQNILFFSRIEKSFVNSIKKKFNELLVRHWNVFQCVVIKWSTNKSAFIELVINDNLPFNDL